MIRSYFVSDGFVTDSRLHVTGLFMRVQNSIALTILLTLFFRDPRTFSNGFISTKLKTTLGWRNARVGPGFSPPVSQCTPYA